MTVPHTLQVVELAQGVAGPALGRILAALGHSVVKCEPPGGDHLRGAGVTTSFDFTALNADKAGVVLDLASDSSVAGLHGLLDTADVLIVDLSPDELSAAGLDRASVAARWPRLSTISMTMFGLVGEWAGREGDSLIAEAFGGVATLIGDPGASPLSLGGEQAQYAAAFAGWLAVGTSLQARKATGRGGYHDVSVADVAAYMDWKHDVAHAKSGLVGSRGSLSSRRWRMVRALDGWVGVIFEPHQWTKLVELIDAPELRHPVLDDEVGRREHDGWWAVVEAWASTRRQKDIYHEAQRLGLPFGYAASVADIADSAQMRSRGFVGDRAADSPALGALFQLDGVPWRVGRAPRVGEHQQLLENAALVGLPVQDVPSPVLTVDEAAPLAGVVVLDFGTLTAGAATTRLLADYGATVIKIESIERFDRMRLWLPGGQRATLEDLVSGPGSELFDSNNAGKLSLVLDLKTPEGQAKLKGLTDAADVLVENFRVGVTERLGIDYPTLSRTNPGLVYLSLSSQGQSGPESRYCSYGSTLDLQSGLASMTGYSADHPRWTSPDLNYPDQLVSLLGAAAVTYCVEQGLSGHLDVAQSEVVSWTLGAEVARYLHEGVVAVPRGNHRHGLSPRGVFPCADAGRWIAISCRTPAHRTALAEVLALDVEDGGDAWWFRQEDEAERRVEEWSSSRTREQAVADLVAAGVPCAPVRDAGDRAVDARFTERQVYLQIGSRRVKGFPFLGDMFQPAPPRRAPRLGEHDDIVLGALTSDDPVGRLRSLAATRDAVDAVSPTRSGSRAMAHEN